MSFFFRDSGYAVQSFGNWGKDGVVIQVGVSVGDLFPLVVIMGGQAGFEVIDQMGDLLLLPVQKKDFLRRYNALHSEEFVIKKCRHSLQGWKKHIILPTSFLGSMFAMCASQNFFFYY